jgi:demethylmenaquinone methyltransferase/2-methoxy-6-polyprenyl-1,4-benzoquinol methylase
MTQAESARHFYDRISGVYDALSDASEQSARQLGLRLLEPAGDQQVLEIGFGTGHAVVEIAQRLAGGGRVFGIDVSPGMLAIAEKRVAAAGLRDRVVELQLGDAKQLPYDDGSFDAVFSSFTLELFSESEIPRLLAEIARLLRPAGRLVVVSMHDDGRKRVMVDLYRFLHRHFPHIVDCQPIDAQACLERAGFEIVANEGISIWGLPVMALLGRIRGSGGIRRDNESTRTTSF